MALTRVRSFTAGSLSFNDLEAEFNNFRDYINNRVLTNPLTQDLDFGNQFTVDNLQTFWEIRNGSEYGGRTGSSIQSAIDSLPSTGGLVFLPGGAPYVFTQTLNLKSGVTFLGAGWGSTILQRTSTATGFTATSNAMILGSAVNDVHFMNLQIDGAAVDNATQGGIIGVRFSGSSSRISFDKCYVRRFGTTSQANSFPNDGIYVGTSGRGVWISRCLFEDFRRNGISVVDAQDFFILGNSLIGNSSVGSGTDSSNTAIDIEPSTGKTRSGVVDGNQIRGWRTGGIFCVGTGAGSTVSRDLARITISDNEIEDLGDSGIVVSVYRDVTVEGNTIDQVNLFTGAAKASLYVVNSEVVQVTDNILLRSGIGQQNVDGIQVTSNSLQRTAMVNVEGNILEQVSRHGIRAVIGGASAVVETVTIQGNTVVGHGTTDTDSSAGIMVENSTGTAIREVDVIGNRVKDPGGGNANQDAIRFTGASSGIVLVGNNVRDGFTGSGVGISGRANVTQLEEGHNLEI